MSRRDDGFSLIEVMVASLVLTIGLVSLVQLLIVSTMTHHDAREATIATQQAEAKLDELVKMNFAAPPVQITGADTLDANVANYFDEPVTAVTRRWRVQAGPTGGTRLVTVRVLNTRARRYGREVELTTVLRQW